MDRCASCGFPTREGRQFCPVCDGTSPYPDAILKDGTRLYLTTPIKINYEQLWLYEMLLNDKPFNLPRPINPLRPQEPYKSKYFIDRRFDPPRPIEQKDIYEAMQMLWKGEKLC